MVGCHSDSLLKVLLEGEEELLRAPQVQLAFPITATSMRVANPYGGLLYVAVQLNHLTEALSFQSQGRIAIRFRL